MILNDTPHIELLNMDNMRFMDGCVNQYFDLAIIDPPTGQGEDKKHASRPYNVRQRNGATLNIKRNHAQLEWDGSAPEQSYYDDLFRISKHQIFFCENYLHFDQKKNSAGRIVWNLLRDNDFSACQILWTSLTNKIDYFEYLWSGMMQGRAINSREQFGNKSLNEKRIHPSQKPIIVYRHLLRTYAQKGWRIFDSHAGSASLAIACMEEGFHFVGCEKIPEIYSAAIKRIQNYRNQHKIQFSE